MNEPTTTNNLLTLFDDPEVQAAFKAFGDAIRELGRLIRRAVDAAARIFHDWWFAIKSTVVPARWAHLARYAKKKRTRAKYQRMISRRWAELLGAVTAT